MKGSPWVVTTWYCTLIANFWFLLCMYNIYAYIFPCIEQYHSPTNCIPFKYIWDYYQPNHHTHFPSSSWIVNKTDIYIDTETCCMLLWCHRIGKYIQPESVIRIALLMKVSLSGTLELLCVYLIPWKIYLWGGVTNTGR